MGVIWQQEHRNQPVEGCEGIAFVQLVWFRHLHLYVQKLRIRKALSVQKHPSQSHLQHLATHEWLAGNLASHIRVAKRHAARW